MFSRDTMHTFTFWSMVVQQENSIVVNFTKTIVNLIVVLKKISGTTNGNMIHPLGTMNVITKFHGGEFYCSLMVQ